MTKEREKLVLDTMALAKSAEACSRESAYVLFVLAECLGKGMEVEIASALDRFITREAAKKNLRDALV